MDEVLLRLIRIFVAFSTSYCCLVATIRFVFDSLNRPLFYSHFFSIGLLCYYFLSFFKIILLHYLFDWTSFCFCLILYSPLNLLIPWELLFLLFSSVLHYSYTDSTIASYVSLSILLWWRSFFSSTTTDVVIKLIRNRLPWSRRHKILISKWMIILLMNRFHWAHSVDVHLSIYFCFDFHFPCFQLLSLILDSFGKFLDASFST